MAVYETTNGDIVITTPNCDCGLTGGCGKCQPYVIPKYIDHEDFVPLFTEVAKYRLIDDELFKVVDDYPPTYYEKLRQIRDRSHKELGEAWQELATI